MRTPSRKSSGFTLVELAIVMIIIGLLIGGILKGQELIENARLKSLVSQVKGISVAYHTFKDSYKQNPGDMINPGARLPGCAALATCVNAGGDGNGVIGDRTANWSRDDQSGVDTEPTQFWIHLSLANLITGVSTANTNAWGDLYPGSTMGGGFHVAVIAEVGNNQASGLHAILRHLSTGDSHPSTVGDAILTPSQVYNLEQKMDDGVPNTGVIVTDDASGNCWSTGTTLYNLQMASRTCITAFKIQ